MSINSVHQVGSVVSNENTSIIEIDNPSGLQTSCKNSFIDAETRQMLDKATGLMQTIVSERISEKVIRKIPGDEYLELLSLIDEMVSGTIDRQV